MPDEEWDALGPDDDGRGEESHPQYHLKRLLDRIGVARDEVRPWRRRRARCLVGGAGQGGGPCNGRAPIQRQMDQPCRGRAAADRHSCRRIARSGQRGPGHRDRACAKPIEIAGKTAALVTPDRNLAARVSAHLQRWGIEADDSAGLPLSQSPAGTLLLAIAAAAVERLAPVPLLALLKHPLVGGEGDDRLEWLDAVRALDLALRGPRPRAGHRRPRRAVRRAEGGARVARIVAAIRCTS